MFRILYFLPALMCCLPSSPSAAQPARDSLRSLILTMPEDTTKLDVYFAYGFLMENVDLDSAAFYYTKAGEISDRYGHVEGKIRFASNYSFVLNMLGKLDESYALNREAYLLASKHNRHADAAKSLVNMGNVHNHRGEYDSTVSFYLRGAALYQKAGEPRYLHIIYQNIGVAFDAMDQYDQALEYGAKSLALSIENRDSLTLASVLNNVAGTYSSKGRYDTAIQLGLRAVEISRKVGYQHGQQASLVTLGDAYRESGEPDNAVKCFQESLNIASKMEFPSGQANALHGLATAYYGMKRYDLAHRYGIQGLRISEQQPFFTDLRQQYKLLAAVEDKRGRAANAYGYLRKYVNLNDSLSGNDIRKITADLERRYQTALKDQRLEEQDLKLALNANQIRNQNILLIGSAVASTLLGVLLTVMYRYHRQRQKMHHQILIALQQEQELVRLKARLDGQQYERQRIASEIHDDIGSGLTSIVFLANSLNGVTEADSRQTRIATLATQMVNQMNEIVWSLSVEQDHLEDLASYIRHNISAMLDNFNVEYEFSIPEDIPDITLSGIQRRNLYLVVKEAVHNAIKHAGASRIALAMDFAEGIRITVADNGRGMPGEFPGIMGHGLKNMEERMKQIGGEWSMISRTPVVITAFLPFGHAL